MTASRFETAKTALTEGGIVLSEASERGDGWEIAVKDLFRLVWNDASKTLLLQRPAQGPESWTDAAALPDPSEEDLRQLLEAMVEAAASES